MSENSGAADRPPDRFDPCPPLPGSAGAIAGFSILCELALVGEQGLWLDDPGVPISIGLTVAAVLWVSYGVLAGRTVRTVLAGLILGLSTVGFALDAVFGAGSTGWALVGLALSLGALGSFISLVRSPYYAWQRHRHDTSGSPVAGVLVLAAVSGVLGPVSGPMPGVDDGPGSVMREGPSGVRVQW